MTGLLTPPRRYDPELLEDPGVSDALIQRSVGEIARSNTVFGGTHAVLAELTPLLDDLPSHATLLDVGTGIGDIPYAAQRGAARRGTSLRTIGLENGLVLARSAHQRVSHAICGSGLAIPFADRSVDIVMCSQVLHHFRGDAARTLLREMHRVARVAVLVSDLRRSWIAAGGFWLASFPLLFHPMTRHDGVVSVMRGFTAAELGETVHEAVGIRPVVRRHLGFRLTACWRTT